ncbi:uncharacterized protein [Chelonus insularis]|uniref:uncharacterized protein n=1 Tax=Chelonus insularis TaxID=460826 RepID=UPI00158D5B4D|nr:uncharacterized protein LOC118074449 [Chelonus insularis]
MRNIVLIIIGFTVTLSLAENKTDTQALEARNQSIEGLIYSDDNLKISDNLKKRNSGYSYPKPNRAKFRSRFTSNGSSKNRGKFSRLNVPVRPFETYGPPKQTSQQFSINNHPSRRPSIQQNKNKFHSGAEGIRFPSNNLGIGNFHYEVPSPIRETDFIEPSPIASQNEEPFKVNFANYLPPKNQRLPIHQTSSIFLTSAPSANSDQHINNHKQNLINQHPPNFQVSDAAQFLVDHSRAISQLYDAPALNIDYAPINEDSPSFDNQGPNVNLNLQNQNLGHETNQKELLSIQNLQRSFPSYASGTLEPYRSLEQIQSLEKDRLIAQLQQELVQRQVQDPSRYAQHNEGENEKLLSVQSSHLDNSASILGLQGVPFGTRLENSSGRNSQTSKIDRPSLTYGFPTITTPLQTTSSTAISNASVDRPQNSGEGSSHGGTLVPMSSKLPTVFPFPQTGGFIPTLIAGTNLASLPSYGTTFVGSNSFHSPGQVIESSPTHFDIPIPTIPSNNKPLIGGSTLTPTSPKPIDSPGSSSSLHPISSAPLQPIFPAIPTVTQVQTPASPLHPTYNQPALINSVFLKPVKPVYPLYYYPNVPYQLQKPQYVFPWNYAPTYAQAKSSDTSK